MCIRKWLGCKRNLWRSNKKGGDNYMCIEKFLKTLELPKKYYDSDFDISEKYAEETKIFIEGIRKIDGSEFSDKGKKEKVIHKFSQLIPNVDKNVRRIIKIFKYYEEADLKLAQDEFDALMDSLAGSMFVSTIDDWCKISTPEGNYFTQFRTTGGRNFYRVRGVSGKRKDIENNPDELFHIPLNKKSLTNNERFSLAGFPCLYLSSMLPLAWQETGYPQKYYYSEYQYIKTSDLDRKIEDELRFLALYSPLEISNWGAAEKIDKFDLWIQVIYNCLMMYPLVLACSFVNHSGKGTYKQEYVIPQMLMQWVMRNNHEIQGISYFTCVDISMMQGSYCAYNVVIPALKPYDILGYSQKLRDEFNWTVPEYFEIPLFDSNYNRDDMKKLYNFISEIRNLNKIVLSEVMRCYIDDIERICICLYHLMLSGNNSDMQMTIHILNLINTCYRHLDSQSIDKLIEDGRKNNNFLSDSDFEIACLNLKDISTKFLIQDGENDSIVAIINRYKNTVWNDFHHESFIDIGYRKGESFYNIEKWCHEHHLLYIKHEISDDDANELGKTIEEIDTPLIKRRNSISIYDRVKYKPVDYIQEGFDPMKDGMKFLGDIAGRK